MASSENTQIVEELEALSESMYQSHTRRTASLALPRTAVPPITAADEYKDLNPKPRSRRLSLSPWRSRPKLDNEETNHDATAAALGRQQGSGKSKWSDDPPPAAAASGKKGIWSWKPIRALSHIGMQRLSCLFSIEVVAIQGLPASMNGLRLTVCVRKRETKEGAVQTMPSRVSHGGADFEETLFIRCHVYYAPGQTRTKFEPRPFLIYVAAVDADELDFGTNSVDLSGLIQRSVEKSLEGARVRQWDAAYELYGKAKGGELVVKLGFQIMEKDGAIGIYSQAESVKKGKEKTFSPSVGRNQSKSSFSVPSPRMSSRGGAKPATQTGTPQPEIDDLNLDEPAPLPPPREPETKADDGDFPDFEVVDKGVEIQDKDESEEEEEENSEVVKEVVQDQSHLIRLTELDSIAEQIKALESLMGEEKEVQSDAAAPMLDAEEDKVTREFLQMLENADTDDHGIDEMPAMKHQQQDKNGEETEAEAYLPDLGKGLGCVVQTRNGGYLAAMNPLDIIVSRKDIPKLAMQMTKPLVLQSSKPGFELFQKMAAMGLQELTSEIFSSMPMDDLSGKTAEQIAFEGIASAVIQGRKKERATSSAARTIAAVKTMGTAMSSGRKERISTGIWNVSEEPLTIDDVLAFSMQKIESMAVDALQIQADISKEVAPFDVSPLDPKTSIGGKVYNHLLASATPVEDWIKGDNIRDASESITVCVVVQLRDPLRQYEAVGGPLMVLIQATPVSEKDGDEERRYKVGSLQVGGIKTSSPGNKNVWNSEKQRLTALQWLVAYGIGKKENHQSQSGGKGGSLLWSISSRVMADMWLKSIRNPDVKFIK